MLALSTPAAATEPPSVKRPAPAELSRFRAALREGRKLARRGDLAAARKALERALAILPGEPQATDELGVINFRLGDLAAAEALARQAAAATTFAPQRARALYNLGRVEEARGAKDEAIDAYRRSLADRPNATVRGRLAALDPQAVPPEDALAPQPLAGPFASVKAWCEDAGECDGGELVCHDRVPDVATPGPPFETARVVWASCTTDEPRELTHAVAGLAMHVAGKWYVGELERLTNDDRNDQSFEDVTLEARPLVAGGPPRLAARWTSSRMYRGMDASAEEKLVVAAVGPSGRPSMSGAILVSVDSDESDEETGETKATHGARFEVRFLDGDVVEIGGPRDVKGRGVDAETNRKLVGKHALRFP